METIPTPTRKEINQQRQLFLQLYNLQNAVNEIQDRYGF